MNVEKIIADLKGQIGNVLTVNGLKKAAKLAAQAAASAMPGATGAEKAAFAEKWLLQAVEEYDNKIPVLGAFMDLPIIDRLEAAAVRAAVTWGYSAMKLDAA